MPRPLDLTGQKFGELTVIKKSKTRKSNRIAWDCKCSCGNETIVITSHLTSGHTRSCGCLHKKAASKMNPAIDITNQRFGKLIAIKKVESKNNHTYWECQCDCGNTCIVRTNSLRSGHTTSCGCVSSKGEEEISKWLINNNIPFERQKTFDSCRDNKTNYLLRFDFFINNQFLLEYDGVTHFKATGSWNDKDAVKNIQEKDNIKNIWASNNNIPLYRISYNNNYSQEKLDETLKNILLTEKIIFQDEESAF